MTATLADLDFFITDSAPGHAHYQFPSGRGANVTTDPHSIWLYELEVDPTDDEPATDTARGVIVMDGLTADEVIGYLSRLAAGQPIT
ncbi:hypothetical protein [Catenuloplanes indicus]|uniref:Uncharacterized protein n=1 Tax=Catenuloplanes indicus TaxID=137267 RepID=A0AAE4B2G8_9ACTN|nr:hypothetical protein [Catenuloplanes indicus]MDQ0363367.1 hypothetical protein [Catenuloplanes indicus]MDQ0371689.1 hypothetical protein [Catenuloplanes indicus]